MKKLGLILICLFAGLATNSCSDSDEAPVEDMLTVLPDVKTVTFSASGETLYADDRPIDPVFRITTTAANWDVETASLWCSVEKDEENRTFTLRAQPNTSETQVPEVAVVTVSAGNASPVEIAVSQQPLSLDVYVAGYVYYEPMVRTAVYWKNGTLIPLIGQGIDSYVKQMQLIGNDLYVLGGFDDPTEGWVIGYWKTESSMRCLRSENPKSMSFT